METEKNTSFIRLHCIMITKKIFLVWLIAGASCNLPRQDKTVKDGNNKSNHFSIEGKKAVTYSTAKDTGDRISVSDSVAFVPQPQPVETDICIFVDPAHRFQTITGFGGALTDASAETFARLPAAAQSGILKAYYDTTEGIGYNIARTNINSCDFSSESYTYVKDFDSTLQSFSIQHDEQYKIPLIKRVNKALNGRLLLFASPWSPPAWMKDNDDMMHGGKLKPPFFQAWANYFVRFIQAYEKDGVPIWGLSIQNEPMASQKWESCLFSAAEERDFLKNYLGPTLEKSGLKDKKIIAWDHNRDLMFQRADALLSDPEAAKYVWGIGFHWYETWTKSKPLFDNVSRVREAFPDTHLMFTEGCIEKFDPGKIHDWSLGELYADNIIHDLNNGITAWCDWNILLDQTGGPNHAGNFCYAPIIADVHTGRISYTSEYWYIGQFSRFIRPGARRVSTSSNRDYLQATSFLNTNGRLAVVVLNRTDQTIPYHLWIGGRWAPLVAKPHSISTTLI
jgi:glucosylceramidase